MANDRRLLGKLSFVDNFQWVFKCNIDHDKSTYARGASLLAVSFHLALPPFIR